MLLKIFASTPIRWLLAIAYTLLITVILLQSAVQPVIDTGIPPGPPSFERELFFSIMHVLGFGLLTVLWWWALLVYLPHRRALIVAVVIALVFGAVTEWLQGFAPDRAVQITDFLANCAGVAFAGWGLQTSTIRHWYAKLSAG